MLEPKKEADCSAPYGESIDLARDDMRTVVREAGDGGVTFTVYQNADGFLYEFTLSGMEADTLRRWLNARLPRSDVHE